MRRRMGEEEDEEENEEKQRATTWISWQLDPASRPADCFLLFNPMKRLILQTNRISRPAVHYIGRKKGTTGSGNNPLFPVTTSFSRI